MGKQRVAVFDKEEEYAFRLSNRMNLMKQGILEAEVFTETGQLLQFLQEYPTAWALICCDGEVLQELTELGKKETRVVLLSEGETVCGRKDFFAIYKYQSAKDIIRQLLEHFAETDTEFNMMTQRRLKVYGIWSPVRYLDVTAFCFGLGHVLAEEYRTLYLNPGIFSGLMLQEEKGLSDLMYYIVNDKPGSLFFLESIVQKLEGVYLIPPPLIPEDCNDIYAKDWQKLIHLLESSSTFERILYQVDEGRKDMSEQMKLCDEILCLVPEGEETPEERAFHNYLERMEPEGVRQTMRRVVIRDGLSEYRMRSPMERSRQSELAESIRQVYLEMQLGGERKSAGSE